jgi:hypothetical protein
MRKPVAAVPDLSRGSGDLSRCSGWSFFVFAEGSYREGDSKSKNNDLESHSKHGRRYDRAFKEDAVALVAGGGAQREVARDLAIPLNSLNSGVR